MEKFKVFYTVKINDRTSNDFGLLLDKTVKFSSLQDAIKFVRTVQNVNKTNIGLVGKPAIERM